MIKVESQVMLAPGIGDRIMKLPFSTIPPYIVVEHMGDSGSVSMHYEETDDGSSWTVVPGTTVVLDPGESSGQIVSATKRQLALFASGNNNIHVTMVRQQNGVTTEFK